MNIFWLNMKKGDYHCNKCERSFGTHKIISLIFMFIPSKFLEMTKIFEYFLQYWHLHSEHLITLMIMLFSNMSVQLNFYADRAQMFLSWKWEHSLQLNGFGLIGFKRFEFNKTSLHCFSMWKIVYENLHSSKCIKIRRRNVSWTMFFMLQVVIDWLI